MATGTIKSAGIAALLAGSALLAAGCRPEPKPAAGMVLTNAVNPVSMNRELNAYLDQAYARMIGAASDIAVASRNRAVRENALRLKIRTHAALQEIQAEPDPRATYLYAWASIVQLRQYLTEGAGKNAYGDQQHLAVEAVRQLERDIIELGSRYFPPEAIESAKDDIELLASPRAAAGRPGAEQRPTSPADEADLLAILRIPLVPVTALEGVSSTPEAIGRFTTTAQGLTSVVQHMPERVRWELELLLLEAESSGAPGAALRKLDDFNENVRVMTETARKMPAEARKEFEQALETFEEIHPKFQATVTEARQTAAELNSAVGKADAAVEHAKGLTENLEKAGVRITETAQAWQATVAEVRGLLADWNERKSEEEPTKDTKEGTDYVELMEKTRQAAQETKGLVVELNRPAAENTSLDKGIRSAKSIIDAVFWRAVALVIVILFAAVAYRLARRRIEKGSST